MHEKIRKILMDRGLASHMNDTKWQELCTAVRGLPFAPAYQSKLLFEDDPYPQEFDHDPMYLGDWGRTPEARLGVQFEWIKVAPRYRRRGRGLGVYTIDDCSDLFLSILKRLNVPFVYEDGFFTIYGHSGSIAFE